MKRLYQKNKVTILFIFTLCLAFVAGYAVGGLKTNAKTKSKAEPAMVTQERHTAMTTPAKISIGEFMLTGYCICPKCCGDYSDGYTATMTKATPGRTIAVDPDVIPYGTVVEINGGEYIAEDCGGDIKGNHIDILCASHELAEAYGVQYAEIYIVTEARQ